MNKKILIGIAVFVGLTAIGFGIFQSSAAQANPTYSVDEIKAVVTSQYPGTITEVELEKKGKTATYEVEVIYEDKEYEIKLDGNTGEILKLKEGGPVAMKDTDGAGTEVEEMDIVKPEEDVEKETPEEVEPKETPKETDKSNQAVTKEEDVKTTVTSKQNESVSKHDYHDKYNHKNKYNNKNKSKYYKEKYKDKQQKHEESSIGIEKAINIALGQFPGTVTEVELDRDNGRLIYEIEVISSGMEADFDIDAKTGEIISVEKQNTDKYAPGKTVIDMKQAIAIAQKEFSGTVTSVELDKDNDQFIYEIEIKSGNDEADFDIDAYTGKILSIEIDND